MVTEFKFLNSNLACGSVFVVGISGTLFHALLLGTVLFGVALVLGFRVQGH